MGGKGSWLVDEEGLKTAADVPPTRKGRVVLWAGHVANFRQVLLVMCLLHVKIGRTLARCNQLLQPVLQVLAVAALEMCGTVGLYLLCAGVLVVRITLVHTWG